MVYIDVTKLTDDQKSKLVDARWSSSEQLWETINNTYKTNTAIYENKADWLQNIPTKRRTSTVQDNRIFVNMEAVINSLIANPPGINVIPSRKGQPAADFARQLESYFRKKYTDLNIKETVRMGLRNLYFARLLVIKAYWNPLINDFDFRSVDPRKIRVGKYARKERDSEFVIEEIDDNLCAVIDRFPAKKAQLMKEFGFTDETELYIKNPDITYKEAWINNQYVIFKYQNIILATIKNPYWDWEGILVTEYEETQLNSENEEMQTEKRRTLLQGIKLEQDKRKGEIAEYNASLAQPEAITPPVTVPNENAPAQPQMPAQPTVPEQPEATGENEKAEPTPNIPTPPKYRPYFFNYFDNPRKPYIYATILNNENKPIGRTDMITLSAELQRGIDKRKMDIDENCEMANGLLKVDASVMGKSDAQRIRFETRGVIWGKGVKDGVTRETGQALPDIVFKDMQDSRNSIDNIMAATSAFRGEREGQETKSGRLALIQQSYLRLNELVQVVDFVSKEVFDWGMQLAKTRYTEYHYAKWLGKDEAREVVELIQDDFENGSEVIIIPGKTLPVDDEFKFEQAQNDVKAGYISPIDYLQIAKYDNAKELSKNAFLFKVSPFSQFNITDEERAKIPPPLPASTLRETIAFDELPPAGKVQFLQRMGITVTEEQVIAKEVAKMVLEGAAKANAIGSPPDTEGRIAADYQAGDATPPTPAQ